MKPIILVNFKTYKEGTGKNAVELAKKLEKMSKAYDVDLIFAVQAVDIPAVSNAVSVPIYCQHIDSVNYGSNTGFILAEAVKEAGAKGTLINHSEHQITMEEIERITKKVKFLGMKAVICANTPKIGEQVAKFKPDFIAVEPPELIGGKISVAEAKPDIIKDAVKLIGNNVLVGAGVNNADDLRISLKLGAKGILLASAIVKSETPDIALKNILKALD
jgi:triosephosphate isomerase (TIM)